MAQLSVSRVFGGFIMLKWLHQGIAQLKLSTHMPVFLNWQTPHLVLNSDLVVFEGDYCVKKDGMLISLKSEEYNILKTLSMTDTHQGYPSGRIVYYKNSKYLFRVRDTGAANTEEKVNIDSLKLAIKKFNNNNPQKIDISLRKLRKNKLFIDIYNDKKDLPLYDKIMTYFNSSKDLTWLLKKEYTSWLKNVMEI